MMGYGVNGYPAPMARKIGVVNSKIGEYDVPEGMDIRGRYDEEFAKILTRDALQFVADLQREFRNHIKYALECRNEAKRSYNKGGLPGFDMATRHIRDMDWTCGQVPPAVADRKVEITGPEIKSDELDQSLPWRVHSVSSSVSTRFFSPCTALIPLLCVHG